MKKLIFASFALFMLGACSGNKTLKKINKSFYHATYYHYITGAQGGGNGMIFQVKFILPNTNFSCDSMWINNTRMLAEMTRVKDTVFANGYYFEAGNPQNQSNPMPKSPFFEADFYRGKMRVFIEGETHWINIKSFEQKQPPYMPE